MVKLFVYGLLLDKYPFVPASLCGFEKYRPDSHVSIRQHPVKCVVGQLVDVSDEEFARIDLFEGFPDYYVRFRVLVEDDWGRLVEAWVYQQRDDYVRENGDFVTHE